MLGWEFPPYFAGGVGVVCEALTRALARRAVDITYVMPSGPDQVSASHVQLLVASHYAPNVRVTRLGAELFPYSFPYSLPLDGDGSQARLGLERVGGGAGRLYGHNLLDEIELFAAQLVLMVERLDLDFDLVHAHDWTTFPAALAVKRLTGKPVVVHVHITEFDKSGGSYADPRVWATEKAGMDGADLVVTVSNFVKRRCVEQYFVDPAKIRVVHNGVEHQQAQSGAVAGLRQSGAGKIVLFLGRVTLQKGPDYFVAAARRVLDFDPDVTFVLAGTGDMLPRTIELSAELGIAERMIFAGFVDRDQALELYRQADVFIMPSVSEPFGIVPLEAMDQGVPVILSRQSGVSEVVRHAIKVDFWDVEDLAAKILAALSYPTLSRELRRQGRREARQLNWDAASARVLNVYQELSGGTLVA